VSAKRQRSKPRSKRAGDAIPAEVLAEGSGPNEVVDATPQTLVEAAEDLVEKRKGRKRKTQASEPVEDADVSEASEASEDDDAGTVEVFAEEGELEAASDTDEDLTGDESPDDATAFDAAAGNVPPDMSTSAEGESIAAVEEAVMRAEAEAELGDAEDVEAGEEEELGAALPTTAASMDAAQLKNLVEALVFAADKPVTIQRLRQLTRVGDVTRLEQALVEIAADYTNRGLVLQQVSGGYQFRTNTQYSVWVQQLIAGRPVRLSRAQLETLAIVAYRQPITRPEIDDIRGVDSSATLRLLLDRALIRTLGKKEDVGRPMLYGTTKEFLDFFSLGDLRELPTLREYSELTAESRKVMTDRLGVDPGAEPANDETPDGFDAKPAVEVDAWGQVVNIPDEEPAAADDSSTSDEVLASAETDVEAGSEETPESTDVVVDGDDESVEMSATTDLASETGDDDAPALRLDAWGQVISTEDAASDEDVAAERGELSDEDVSAAGDERSVSGESDSADEDVSPETAELSASDDAAAEGGADDEQSMSEPDVSTESDAVSAAGDAGGDDDVLASSADAVAESDEPDATLGAPAGASMEDRIDLAGSDASSSDDASDADELSADEASDEDENALLASADDVVANEDVDDSGEPGDEPSSRD
jgi:segregation and condensation protein B